MYFYLCMYLSVFHLVVYELVCVKQEIETFLQLLSVFKGSFWKLSKEVMDKTNYFQSFYE